MSEGQAFELAISGVVKFFSTKRNYGFIEFSNGESDLFFSLIPLLRAGRKEIEGGVKVLVVRGVAKDGRPHVEDFLEIDGVRIERESHDRSFSGGFEFYPEKKVSRGVEKGVVQSFNKERGFGFILVDGGGVLFFFIVQLVAANMKEIEPGTKVAFIRGLAKDKRPKVSCFVEIDGKPVENRQYRQANDAGVLNPGMPPSAEPQKPTIRTIEITESKPASAPAELAHANPPQRAAPVIDKDEWLLATLRKVRKGHTSYADSELFGQIIVPWDVMEKAKITSARSEEKFELKCQPGDNLPVAHEIRRY